MRTINQHNKTINQHKKSIPDEPDTVRTYDEREAMDYFLSEEYNMSTIEFQFCIDAVERHFEFDSVSSIKESRLEDIRHEYILMIVNDLRCMFNDSLNPKNMINQDTLTHLLQLHEYIFEPSELEVEALLDIRISCENKRGFTRKIIVRAVKKLRKCRTHNCH